MLPIASVFSAALLGWAWIGTILLAISMGGTRHEQRPLAVPPACEHPCGSTEDDGRAVARLIATYAPSTRVQ